MAKVAVCKTVTKKHRRFESYLPHEVDRLNQNSTKYCRYSFMRADTCIGSNFKVLSLIMTDNEPLNLHKISYLEKYILSEEK